MSVPSSLFFSSVPRIAFIPPLNGLSELTFPPPVTALTSYLPSGKSMPAI